MVAKLQITYECEKSDSANINSFSNIIRHFIDFSCMYPRKTWYAYIHSKWHSHCQYIWEALHHYCVQSFVKKSKNVHTEQLFSVCLFRTIAHLHEREHCMLFAWLKCFKGVAKMNHAHNQISHQKSLKLNFYTGKAQARKLFRIQIKCSQKEKLPWKHHR